MNFEWPFPAKISWKYRLSSNFILASVAAVSKIWLEWFNRVHVVNKETFANACHNRSEPLITVSNHNSCMDDPFMWGTFKWRDIFSPSLMRWTMAADNILFTNFWHIKLFSLGRCVPIVRGNGVYQKGVDFCLEKLNENEWVHMFPEGKVNTTKEKIRLKWGVGRLVADCAQCPAVYPIWHVGIDDILPNKKPYIPLIGKRVTILYGEKMDFRSLLKELRERNATAIEMRKAITDRIEVELDKLKEKAEKIHEKVWKL